MVCEECRNPEEVYMLYREIVTSTGRGQGTRPWKREKKAGSGIR